MKGLPAVQGLILILCLFEIVMSDDTWSPPAVCLLPKKRGPCAAQIPNFHYNKVSGRCEQFMFSGCGGNENRYRTEEMCLSKCACHIPPEAGPCRATYEKWFYNPTRGCCEKFTYGGCQGNSNNFNTYEDCRTTCVGSSPGMVKPRGSNWGSGSVIRFETNNFYQPQRAYTGAKSIWLHDERANIVRSSAKAKQIIRLVTQMKPEMKTKEHWHFMTGQASESLPKVGGLSLQTLMSSGSQMKPSGKSRVVLRGSIPIAQMSKMISGSASQPSLRSGGSISVATRTGGGTMGGGSVMGGGRLMGGRAGKVGGWTSGSSGTGGGTIGGGSVMGGGRFMGGRAGAVDGWKSGSSGSRGIISGKSMMPHSGASIQGRMMSDQPFGNNGGDNFISKSNMIGRHPPKSVSGFASVTGNSGSSGIMSGQPVGGSAGIWSRSMRGGSLGGGPMGMGSSLQRSGKMGVDLIGGNLKQPRSNIISAKSSAWHP